MNVFSGQFFAKGQLVFLEFCSVRLKGKIVNVKNTDEIEISDVPGMFVDSTVVIFDKSRGSKMNINYFLSSETVAPSIVKIDWDFENMGIGGMDKEFQEILRRAFSSRMYSPAMIQKLGVKHFKGILLYGPPGTGKTLMARQIGKMLNTRDPKIVHGPEILNKYVGQSEENIRLLFKDAEEEYRSRGDDSDLHIIIFDEIDSICRTRGTTSGSTGVGDTVVNQLLSKIDGVQSLNNILVIGMTNRKDMIDEAVLRPGRLEVHIEISLPNEEGRHQIFRIHTSKMRKGDFLAKDVDLRELASRTKNYTGAEIESVVKGATSFALYRQIDTENIKKQQTDLSDCHERRFRKGVD
jgi:vesicle-fusing ATPase